MRFFFECVNNIILMFDYLRINIEIIEYYILTCLFFLIYSFRFLFRFLNILLF